MFQTISCMSNQVGDLLVREVKEKINSQGSNEKVRKNDIQSGKSGN